MGRIDRAFAAVFQPIGRAVLLNRNAAACRNRQLRRTVDRGLIADLTAVCVGLAVRCARKRQRTRDILVQHRVRCNNGFAAHFLFACAGDGHHAVIGLLKQRPFQLRIAEHTTTSSFGRRSAALSSRSESRPRTQAPPAALLRLQRKRTYPLWTRPLRQAAYSRSGAERCLPDRAPSAPLYSAGRPAPRSDCSSCRSARAPDRRRTQAFPAAGSAAGFAPAASAFPLSFLRFPLGLSSVSSVSSSAVTVSTVKPGRPENQLASHSLSVCASPLTNCTPPILRLYSSFGALILYMAVPSLYLEVAQHAGSAGLLEHGSGYHFHVTGLDRACGREIRQRGRDHLAAHRRYGVETVQTQTDSVQVGQAGNGGLGRGCAVFARSNRHDRLFLLLGGVVVILHIHERNAVVTAHLTAESVLGVGQITGTAGAGADLGQQRRIADEHGRHAVQLGEELVEHIEHGLVVGVDRRRGGQVDCLGCIRVELGGSADKQRVQTVKALGALVAVDGGVVEQVGGRLDVLLELELHLVDLAVRGVSENTVDLERTAEDLEVNRLGFAVGYGVGVVGVDVTEVRACRSLELGVAIGQGRAARAGGNRVVKRQCVQQHGAAAELVDNLLVHMVCHADLCLCESDRHFSFLLSVSRWCCILLRERNRGRLPCSGCRRTADCSRRPDRRSGFRPCRPAYRTDLRRPPRTATPCLSSAFRAARPDRSPCRPRRS
nr:MAG TPA_asm: hypothetical protein [Caudoviricetes sp.]